MKKMIAKFFGKKEVSSTEKVQAQLSSSIDKMLAKSKLK